MTPSYHGFAFTVPIRRPGGFPGERRLLVIAKDVYRATEIALSRTRSVTLAADGPEVLARAHKLGIRNDDSGFDDGKAS